jgi:hypothetical protein
MLAPVLLAAALAGAYLVWEPPSADLAAQTFRADLFAAHGFLIWNNDWYAGHYLPGYSVVFPPLGAWLGPRLAGALAAVAAAAAFTAIARRQYGDRAMLGTLWFAAGTATLLLTGRITFALGVAIALAALLALQRRRLGLATALAAACGLASPVAGVFLAIAGAAVALTGDRRGGGVVAAAAIGAVAALSLAFPSGGREPFVFTAFLPIPLFAAAALWLIPRRERALRYGVVIYLAFALVAYLVPSPIGGNATRLGALFAGPVLALVLAGRRTTALALVALPLVWWQWVAPVRDVSTALGDPSTQRSYYEPLLGELQSLTGDPAPSPVRVEVVPTRNRWEAAYVAPSFPIVHGWLRQDEWDDRALFTGGNLTPAAYRAWLDERGVSYVALSDARRDYLGLDEAALIESGLPYLDQVWANDHWRLYRVRDAPGLAEPPARVTDVEPDSFTLAVPRAGSYLVRFHWTRYWAVTAGDACLEPAGDWTRVEAGAAGTIEVAARFSLSRLFDAGERCSG